MPHFRTVLVKKRQLKGGQKWLWHESGQSQIFKPPVFALKIGDQVAQGHVESFGDSHKRIQGNIHISAFDLANIFGIETGCFRKPLLAQLRLFAIGANFFTHNSTMLRFGHRQRTKQEFQIPRTGYIWNLFLSCIGTLFRNTASNSANGCGNSKSL